MDKIEAYLTLHLLNDKIIISFTESFPYQRITI